MQDSILPPHVSLMQLPLARGDQDGRAAAASINAAGVHVLVDLLGFLPIAGPTAARALAHRPAPVLLSVQSFHGAMGDDWIDSALVDAVAVPPDFAGHHDERLLMVRVRLVRGEGRGVST
jgi:predicted O-linked N-acetylglucosamine transferase (SPINDLY family)